MVDEWSVLRSHHEERGLVGHQIKSFDQFVEVFVQKTVDETPILTVAAGPIQVVTEFGRAHLVKPNTTEADGDLASRRLLPSEARLRNLTYAASLYVDMVRTVSVDGVVTRKTDHSRTFFGEVPVMVASCLCNLHDAPSQDLFKEKECPQDGGGYFIVNGTEKVVLAQERMATNLVYVFKARQTWTAECRSTQDVALRGGSILKIACTATGPLNVQLPQLKGEVPLLTVFVALGGAAGTHLEFMRLCSDGSMDPTLLRLLVPELELGAGTKAAAEQAIADRWTRAGVPTGGGAPGTLDVEEYLDRELLPHVARADKASFIGYMVWRLLRVRLGLSECDDRDNYVNKRVDQTGVLLAQLFRQLYKKVRNEYRLQIVRSLEKGRDTLMGVAINRELITRGLRYSLATGMWGVQGTPSTRQGISQVLNRHSQPATLSHLRRIESPSREGKLTQPRQVHNTQWGMLCPAETPEGATCGLVKNMAITVHVTLGFAAGEVLPLLRTLVGQAGSKVFLNGTCIGRAASPSDLVDTIRSRRRRGCLSPELSVAYNLQNDSVSMFTDGGRVSRPLFVVTGGKIAAVEEGVDFARLVATGAVEYLDVSEEYNALIAMRPADLPNNSRFTHCEIHPSTMLGVLASMIPHSHRNQSPRVAYQASMGKQAVGVYSLAYQQRFDTVGYVLNYPQKPLVTTKPSELMREDECAAGVNCIVAVLTASYNQEARGPYTFLLPWLPFNNLSDAFTWALHPACRFKMRLACSRFSIR